MAIENLIENVDNQIINIRTKSLDVSFNELYDMYTDGELVISPDYQRLFRWEEEKQSRFIESLILEMPVPPIFVIEIKDGVYELSLKLSLGFKPVQIFEIISCTLQNVQPSGIM